LAKPTSRNMSSAASGRMAPPLKMGMTRLRVVKNENSVAREGGAADSVTTTSHEKGERQGWSKKSRAWETSEGGERDRMAGERSAPHHGGAIVSAQVPAKRKRRAKTNMTKETPSRQ